MFITKVSFFFLILWRLACFLLICKLKKLLGGWLAEERNATPSGVAHCAKRAVEMVKSRRLN